MVIVYTCHGLSVETGGQFCALCSFPSFCGFQGLKSQLALPCWAISLLSHFNINLDFFFPSVSFLFWLFRHFSLGISCPFHLLSVYFTLYLWSDFFFFVFILSQVLLPDFWVLFWFLLFSHCLLAYLEIAGRNFQLFCGHIFIWLAFVAWGCNSTVSLFFL